MQHQYEELVLVGETTHSANQPGGKVVTPANTSSKVIPENKDTNKDTAKQKLSLIGLCPNSISEVPSSLAEELHHDALQLVIATLQSMLLFLFR